MSKVEDAWRVTFGYAAGAGATAGLLGLFMIPNLDVLPLTYMTKSMCDKIASIYEYTSLRGLSIFTGLVVGTVTGIKLAAGVTVLIPGIGAGANAIATASLHLITGVSLIMVFEMLQQEKITEEFLRDSPVAAISDLAKQAADAISNHLRGVSPEAAIGEAIDQFQANFCESSKADFCGAGDSSSPVEKRFRKGNGSLGDSSSPVEKTFRKGDCSQTL